MFLAIARQGTHRFDVSKMRAKDKSSRSYGIFAAIALGMMMVGALGMNIVPKDYFGIVERFSVFAATGYNAVLGIELYRMKFL